MNNLLFNQPPPETLGERLSMLIKDRRVTQAEVAKSALISSSTVSSIVQDRCDPRVGDVLQLAQYFNVSPHWLAFGPQESVDIKRLTAAIHQAIDKPITDVQKAKLAALVYRSGENDGANAIDDMLDTMLAMLNDSPTPQPHIPSFLREQAV